MAPRRENPTETEKQLAGLQRELAELRRDFGRIALLTAPHNGFRGAFEAIAARHTVGGEGLERRPSSAAPEQREAMPV
jgi:hypothetical protein